MSVCTSPHINNITRNTHKYNEFVDYYYTDRQKTWNGAHLMKGSTPKKGDLVLMSNDYLSLANDKRILAAQAEALLNCGNSLIMSNVFSFSGSLQEVIEAKMAKFLNAENTIICQSGWAANVGLLQTISDSSTPVYLDMFAHMSLWQGANTTGAPAHAFKHNDANHLETKIKQHGQGIVVVDAVYSTSGSVCNLHDIIAVANHYDCVIIVDESHSLGTHGNNGEGLVSLLGLDDKVHFKTASLAKAFAARSGIITCTDRFREYFKMHSYPAIFSSALLDHELVALDKTLEIIMNSHEKRERLKRNTQALKLGLLNCGYNVSISNSQIIPLEAGPEFRTIKLRDALERRGVFGAVFCSPATPKNRSLIRLSLNADVTPEQIDYVISVCEQIKDDVDLHLWPSSRHRSQHLQQSPALT